MSIAVVFPDVEKVLIDALVPALSAHGMTQHIGTRVPATRPAEFFRILVTGGNRHDIVQDNPTVTVEAWAGTETQASLMARTARAVLESLKGTVVDGVTIGRASDFSSPANLPDPTSAQVRYTFTGSIYLRGTALT